MSDISEQIIKDLIAGAKKAGAKVEYDFSTPYGTGKEEALTKFKIKNANLRFIVPSVAGGVLGRVGGQALGNLAGTPGMQKLLGDVVGPIVGTSLGMSIGDDMERRRRMSQPAHYQHNQLDMDPTMQDIPLWATQLATAARPLMKQSAHQDAGLHNMLAENLVGPFAAVHKGYQQGGVPGAVRVGGGTMLGGLGGTTAGIFAGKALENLLGNQPQLMGIRLPHLLGGLGGVVGGTRAFESLLK